MIDIITADRLVRNTVALNAIFAEGANIQPGNITMQGRVGLKNNNPPSNLGLSQVVQWGAIYRNRENPPTDDVLVKVGNLDLYLLDQSSGEWALKQTIVRPNGQIYESTFDNVNPGDDNVIPIGPATMYSSEPNMIITDVSGENTAYHFYQTRVDYNTIAGIIVMFTAKLVSKSGTDLSGMSGCLLAQVGCDFKTPDGTVIRDAFTSSLLPISKNLRRFAATSMTFLELVANPPDLSLFRQLTQIDASGVDPDYVPA